MSVCRRFGSPPHRRVRTRRDRRTRVVAPAARGAERRLGSDPKSEPNKVTSKFDHGCGDCYSFGSYEVKQPQDGINENNVRFIPSRSGHCLIFDDTDGDERITLTDKTGRQRIVIYTADETVGIYSNKDMCRPTIPVVPPSRR